MADSAFAARNPALAEKRVKAASVVFRAVRDFWALRLRLWANPRNALRRGNFWVPGNVLDDWSATLLVYGTAREVEAQRTLATNYRDTLADNMTEVLLPLKADAEVSDADLAANDLLLFGGPAENGLSARLQTEGKLPLEAGFGWFRWQGRTGWERRRR